MSGDELVQGTVPINKNEGHQDRVVDQVTTVTTDIHESQSGGLVWYKSTGLHLTRQSHLPICTRARVKCVKVLALAAALLGAHENQVWR